MPTKDRLIIDAVDDKEYKVKTHHNDGSSNHCIYQGFHKALQAVDLEKKIWKDLHHVEIYVKVKENWELLTN